MSVNYLNNDESIWKTKVQSLLESGGIDNLNEAKRICETHNIPWSQYESWEGNDNSDSILEDIINKEETINQQENSVKEQITSSQSPKLFNESTQLNANKEKTIYHKNFPYTKKELQKLKVPDLKLIIAGCKSTYGSREILEVLNKSEYLGKMRATLALKYDDEFQIDLHSKLTNNNNNFNTNEGFKQTIQYLDALSYGKHNWSKKINYSGIKNDFDSRPHAQEERLEQIPETEKKYFIRSIFVNPIVTPDAMSNPSNKFFDYRMNSYNKKQHVNLLYELLQNKWNNKDIAPSAVMKKQ